MRIRKNAKISPLVYPASSPNAGVVIQTHFCQLNQSPWDVMSFSPPTSPPPPPLPPPPPSQVNESDAFSGNGCLADDVPVNIESADWKCESIDDDAINKTVQQPKDKPVKFCCKTDGKGWQCQRKAAKGNSLCKHHLSLAKKCNNWNQSKKSRKSMVEAQHRTRPKKAPASSLSNPNEFYYYSGFSPTWSKRRGESRKSTGSDMSQNVEPEHDLIPSLSSPFDEVSDTAEDGGDDNEYENGEIGKKRGRKPIKAKSLKSFI